jgi:hypothetical protein
MQPIITRLRSLRPQRYDSVTGRKRRGGAALAAGVILALVLGSGIAVAAASSAQAHSPKVTPSCAGVHVETWWYPDNQVNTVTVTIVDGVSPGQNFVANRTFGPDIGPDGKDFDEFFAFLDPSVAWSYSVVIDAPDGKDGTEWDLHASGTSTPCSVPKITISATPCVTDETTTVTADIGPLDSGGVYKVRLTGANYDSGESDVLTGSASWSGLEPGVDYTATLTDKVSGLSASDTVHAIGCPSPPGFEVWADQCTTVNGNGSFRATVSGLVSGRSYVLSLVNIAGGAPVDRPFTATGPTYSDSFSTSPSGQYLVRLTDVLAVSSKDSNTLTYLPCPGWPALQIDPTACTTTDGTSNASIVIGATGLVPGRNYSVVVTSGSTTVYSQNLSPAAQSTVNETLRGLAPGTYTFRVTDTTEPATAGFAVSTSTVIKDCPVQQVVELTAQQCTVPGGTGTLTATVTNFAVGRNYIVSLTQNNLPVTGQPASQNFDPIDTTPGVFVYSGLKPGLTYRVMVQDVTGLPVTLSGGGGSAPGAVGSSIVPVKSAVVAGSSLPAAADDIDLTDCPGNPDLFLTQPPCTVLTITTITVGLGKLIPGETYTVAVTRTSDGQPVSGVPDQQVVATTPTASLQFDDVPVGRQYTTTVTNATKTLTATGNIYLSLCELPTLAYTGASTMTPTLAGLGFLQFGLVLVGISLVRRRSGAREV